MGMDEHEHHEDIITKITEEYADILENSEQGIYIYLDDNHKVCNEKFASMLGYSVEEFSKPAEFIDTYVAKDSGKKLVEAYSASMEKSNAAEIDVTWKKKDGTELETEVILVPISFQKHSFALHFISEE